MVPIQMVDLKRQYLKIKPEVDAAMANDLSSRPIDSSSLPVDYSVRWITKFKSAKQSATTASHAVT